MGCKLKNLSEGLWSILTTDPSYQKRKHNSKLEGKKHSWEEEIVQFRFPICDTYSIVSQLSLHGKGEFEEDLYLEYKDAYYILGWIDCHQHDHVFQPFEFYLLLRAVKNQHKNPILTAATFLYLSRFISLTTEAVAIQLTEAVIQHYRELCTILVSLDYTIKKILPYNQTIPLHEDKAWKMKFKQIKVHGYGLGFGINEGAKWVNEPEWGYQLEGFAAHSLRTAIYNKGLTTAIPIDDIHADRSDYSFPYKQWKELMELIR